jgi:hypothetical protein
MKISKASIALAVAAFAVFGAAPAFAKHHHHRVVHRVVRADPALYQKGLDSYGDIQVTPERDAALRECNVAMQKYSDSSWETTKSAVYATCMTNHGQMP